MGTEIGEIRKQIFSAICQAILLVENNRAVKMRRRPGIGAIQKNKVQRERFRDKGTELQESSFEQMTLQMENFRTNLEIASKHRNEIKKDPNFRKQFQEMCSSIGVDPLASSKGFWSELLGVGDFYYEIAVQ